MDKYIRVKNCNCISDATIEIVEKSLNIKYGSNGTGKSTISEAIYAQANNETDRLKDLKPYGSDDNSQPTVDNPYFHVVKVFNEDYVNSYLFQGDEFLDDSFQVFLKSDKCDSLAAQIERQLQSFYATDLIKKLIYHVSDKINALKGKTGQLKGLFLQHEKKLDELIAQRQDDINQFFTIAGFPYNFCLEKDGEKHAKAYLVPCEFQKEMVVDPKNRLSWGEKNAFSLVMFMFEAISDNADLIVLDDPISAFDEKKKFGIIRRLFDNKKDSFKEKTVLMLTHDFQPIIDYVHGNFFTRYGLITPVHASFIQNIEGSICESPITMNDLKNTVELTKDIVIAKKDISFDLFQYIVNDSQLKLRYAYYNVMTFSWLKQFEEFENFINQNKLTEFIKMKDGKVVPWIAEKYENIFCKEYFDELCDRTISYKRNNGIAV